MLKRSVLIVLALFVVAAVVQKQQAQTNPKTAPPAEYKIPPEEAQKANPVRPSPDGTAKARKFYGMDCALCHGANGDGKGDVEMKDIPDFTKPDALKDRTDGELFYVIRKGKGEMPPEDNRAKDDDVWNLVHYVRAMAKK